MEDQMDPSKAAGSSDHVRQHHGHLVSASPSQPTYSRRLYLPYNDENDEFEASTCQLSSRPSVSTSPRTAQPQASTRRMSSYTTPPRRSSKVSTTSPVAQISDDTASTSSSEWDLLDDQPQHVSLPNPFPMTTSLTPQIRLPQPPPPGRLPTTFQEHGPPPCTTHPPPLSPSAPQHPPTPPRSRAQVSEKQDGALDPHSHPPPTSAH
jgi:hypothetical protein